MLDITEISAIVAAAGVIIGVVYYILDMRQQTKTSQTDLAWKLSQTMYADDYREAILKVLNLDFKDYEGFVKKYGPYLSDSPTMKALTKINVLFGGIGNLVETKLIDPKLVSNVFGLAICRTWEKVKPIIEGYRREENMPDYLVSFENLYNEMQKRGHRSINQKPKAPKISEAP
jgi:hypothetical protein